MRCQLSRNIVEFAVILDLQTQVARLAEPQGTILRAVVSVYQVVNGLGMERDFERFALVLHQLAKAGLRRVAYLNLVGNPPQERLINDVPRLKIWWKTPTAGRTESESSCRWAGSESRIVFPEGRSSG